MCRGRHGKKQKQQQTSKTHEIHKHFLHGSSFFVFACAAAALFHKAFDFSARTRRLAGIRHVLTAYAVGVSALDVAGFFFRDFRDAPGMLQARWMRNSADELPTSSATRSTSAVDGLWSEVENCGLRMLFHQCQKQQICGNTTLCDFFKCSKTKFSRLMCSSG